MTGSGIGSRSRPLPSPRASIFVHRALGYSVTGCTSEQAFFMGYGLGSNGKSVLLNAVAGVLGDHSHNLPFTALERGARSSGVFDIADLPGKRFASSSETNEGTHLDEARIKALTGGGPDHGRP